MRTCKWVQWLFIVFAVFAVSGCADRYMVTSFQDITSESKRQGWFYGRQYSSISIPGFIAAYEPGNLFSYNPARGPMTATGMALGEQSYIVSKTIPAGKIAAQTINIGSSAQKDDESDNSASPDANTQGAVKVGGVALVKLKLDAIKTQTLKVVRLRMEQLKTDINNSVPTDETKPFVLDSNIKASDYNSALSELERLERELAALIAESGIMIFRWAYGSESSAQAKVSEAASTSASSAEAGAGYAIINGLKISTLYVGEDILKQWNHVEDIGFWRAWPQIVTQTAQTRELAYATELNLEQTFKAELELSYETTQKIAKNWKEELTLVLKMFSARFEQTANTGILGNAEIRWRQVDWNAPPKELGTVAKPLPYYQQNWITFFQVSTALKALKKTMGGDQPMPDVQ